MDFVQIFDDSERLREHLSVVEFECRDEALRIQMQKVLLTMLAAPQLFGHRVGSIPFRHKAMRTRYEAELIEYP